MTKDDYPVNTSYLLSPLEVKGVNPKGGGCGLFLLSVVCFLPTS